MKVFKTKVFMKSVFCAVTLLSFFWFSGSILAEEFKPVTWIYQSNAFPLSLAPTYLSTEMPKLVAQATNGKVNIVWRQGMYRDVEWLWPLSKNTVQIANVMPALYSTTISEWKLSTLPFLFRSDEEFNAFISGGGGKKWIDDVLARRKLNLQHIFVWTNGGQPLWSPKPVKTIDDWKGYKFRVHPEAAPVVSEFGASPVNIPFQEIALSIDRGVIDGAMMADLIGAGAGYYRKCPYVNRWPLLSCFPMSLMVNRDALEALPQDLQKKVLEVLNNVGRRIITELRPEDIVKTDARLKELGVTIVNPDPAEVDKANAISKKNVESWANEKPEHTALIKLFEKTSNRKVLQ
jgi:TRAP-type C4-dicarboxylate transport system substrate-binding protein